MNIEPLSLQADCPPGEAAVSGQSEFLPQRPLWTVRIVQA